MNLDKFEGFNMLGRSIRKEIGRCNELVKNHTRMIDILYSKAKKCDINMNDYYNDIQYHSEQINIIRERIREIKESMKHLKKIGVYLDSDVFSKNIEFEV